MFPLVFTLKTPLEVTNLYNSADIALYDYDFGDLDNLMGIVGFDLDSYNWITCVSFNSFFNNHKRNNCNFKLNVVLIIVSRSKLHTRPILS
jgi:hypothetical protein